jgi:spore maturation protein CgeB
LAAIYGKNFAISGLNWRRHTNIRRLAVCLPPSYGLDFSKFIRRSPIQLGFLNSDNRDTHTARTFEIPASGALIILKDTSEHRSVFKSELNALFFSTEEQLLEKIEWALSNPALASIIAEKGHKLITQSPNTWTDRAREIICYIKSIDSSI